MKQLRALLLCGVCLVASLVGAAQARANSAASTTYYAQVDGNTVLVLPDNVQERGCEDNVLLREDVASGDVVQLAAYCEECEVGAVLGYEETCFVDECVLAGTYRYGFSVPYDCEPASDSTDYYTVVTVVGTTENCTYGEGNAPPQAVTEGAPWGNDPSICWYAAPGLCSAASGATRSVFSLQFFALAVGIALFVRKRRRR